MVCPLPAKTLITAFCGKVFAANSIMPYLSSGILKGCGFNLMFFIKVSICVRASLFFFDGSIRACLRFSFRRKNAPFLMILRWKNGQVPDSYRDWLTSHFPAFPT